MRTFFFVIVLLFGISCKNSDDAKIPNPSDSLIHYYSANIYEKSDLYSDTGRYANGYFYIDSGTKTILRYTDKLDIPNAYDAFTWNELVIISKHASLNINQTYSLQDTSSILCRIYRGGAWIGILRLDNPRGQFKVVGLSEGSVTLQVIGKIEADQNIKTKSRIETRTIVADTILIFN